MSQSQASLSTLPAISQDEVRPEAGPLPQKAGEFGYVAPTLTATGEADLREVNLNDDAPLPARHPADRDPDASIGTPSQSTAPNAQNTASSVTSDTDSTAKKSLIQRLSWQGVQFTSLLRIFLFLLFLIGTGVAWGVTITRFSKDVQSETTSQPDPPDGQLRIKGAFSSLIFVHVAFTIVVLFELLFLERALYHARAERYMFKNGMPRRGAASAAMGLAPWNRPPLPTYAAALAESGLGTGDVEDNLIAIPPPPAYGNTRGSVLLLSGFIRNSLIRTNSRNSQRSTRTPSPETQMEEGRRSRPISYGASEEIDDARRAMALENTLGRLEDRPRPAEGPGGR